MSAPTPDMLAMLARRVARASDSGAALRAAERADVANKILKVGPGPDVLTMAGLLRYARPEHPALLARMVALTAATYGARPEPVTTPTTADDLPASVKTVRDRVRAQSAAQQSRLSLFGHYQ